MEPPPKRQRLGLGPIETEGEDELDFDPVELNQIRDPAYQFELARDNALYKLQSRFENIFAKYGRDFTGVSDEVDLVTGQVLVDNGHLQSLQSVKDTDDGEEVDEDDEERLLDGPQVIGSTTPGSVMRREPWAVDGSDPKASRHSPIMGGPSRLSSMMYSSRSSLMTPPRSFDSFDSGTTLSIDPAWQAPELPRSAYSDNSSGVSGRQYRFGTGASTRKILRKALPRPQGQEEEDEDVLLGASSNAFRQKEPAVKESPLIKKILPTIDSSPNNEPGLKELIQEVIENIPETPPSVQRPVASKPEMKRHPPGTRTSPHPVAQFKAKPRSSRAVESNKVGPTGVHLDVSQKGKGASLATSPTESIKAQENTKALAGRAGAVTHANKTGKETSYYEEDLVSFQDVTGMPARNSTTQALYVEIEARTFAKGSHTTAQSGVDRDALSSQCHDTSAVTAVGPEKPVSKPPTTQGVMERNVIDPAFIFSDEENLPPMRIRNSRRKSEPACLAAPGSLQASRLTSQQRPPFTDQFERNNVDASYAFSDEERLLPRRRKTTRPIPEPAMGAKLSTEEDSSATRESGHGPVSEPIETLHIHTERKGRRRSMRPLSIAETTVVTRGLDQEIERPRRASIPARSGTVRRSRRTPSDRKRIASPELGESAPLAAGPVIAEVAKEKPKRGSVQATESAPQQQPSTPKSKCKAHEKKNTPSSSRQGLISLLSDNEDEEDEISFDLSAFTPSGQHRILLHGPYPHLTTPRTGPDSTISNKKKRAGSLVFRASSTSKARKHRTPGDEKRSGKGTRRGSTNSLVRSLVKARQDSFGPPSPVGPVVQTPGGTQRRCGKDGYRCERDFCFICISI
ncbi:hypothetical protein VPNG_03687 [Cytospora leucostoma]|uniref:Centromere protein Scm3 n=1 Tax=Cytospora leucostoma TaxID=1230097 RepID=A0A423XF12_9PEZI|nr:hypothetical protein VPNG_03687 [Cytospora leucostoma]